MPAHGHDPSAVRTAHEGFVASGRLDPGVRDVVADSWRRSRRSGVDPEHVSPTVDLTGSDLLRVRAEHPLAPAIPVVRDLLLGPDAGWVAALMDASGRLLWVEGDAVVRRRVERVGFVEGAMWREDTAGTNAPGTALATDREVHVLGAEHWSRPVQGLNCAAAPVHDADGRVLGVLDITGGSPVSSGMARSLVRATVAAVEAIVARTDRSPRVVGPDGTRPGSGPAEPRLRVLGARDGELRTPQGVVRLNRRHAEILLLLAEHPEGLSSEELAIMLSEEDLSVVTFRAEVSRLRRVAGPLLAESRPYRLVRDLHTDVDAVRAALAVGDVAQALASCPGPVLARSTAPGVVAVREALAADLRAAVLASNDPDVIARWTAADVGAEDWWAWQRLAVVAPSGSPHALRARTRLATLDRALA